MQTEDYSVISVFTDSEIPYDSSTEAVTDKTTTMFSMSIVLITPDNKVLDVANNLVYFRYSYMHGWFGPYIAATFLFQDRDISTKGNIIRDHSHIKVRITDNCGSIELKFRKGFSTALTHEQTLLSEGISISSFTAIYYPEILFQLAKQPSRNDIEKMSADITSLRSLLQKYEINLVTSSYYSDATSLDTKVPRLSTLAETIVAVLNSQVNVKRYQTGFAKITSANSDKILVHDIPYASKIDVSHIYPFRIGTDATGEILFITHFLDYGGKTYDETLEYCFLGSLTSDMIDYKTITKHLEPFKKVILSDKKSLFKVNQNYLQYIKNHDKVNVNITISYGSRNFNYKIKLGHLYMIQNYDNIPLQTDNQIVLNDLVFSCNFTSRQSLAVQLLNEIHFASVLVFDSSTFVPVSDFFRFNSGNIMWSKFTFMHMAITDKIENTSDIEVILFQYHLAGINIEVVAKKNFAHRVCKQQFFFAAPYILSKFIHS